MIFRKVTDLIGNTPVIQLPLAQSESRLYIKVEKNNPGGSMKDRMARLATHVLWVTPLILSILGEGYLFSM